MLQFKTLLLLIAMNILQENVALDIMDYKSDFIFPDQNEFLKFRKQKCRLHTLQLDGSVNDYDISVETNHDRFNSDSRSNGEVMKRDLIRILFKEHSNYNKTLIPMANSDKCLAVNKKHMALQESHSWGRKPPLAPVSGRDNIRQYPSQQQAHRTFVFLRGKRSIQSSKNILVSGTETVHQSPYKKQRIMFDKHEYGQKESGKSYLKPVTDESGHNREMSLTDVYTFLNDVLLSASANDTDGSDFPNMTIDTEALCLKTLNIYYKSLRNVFQDDGQVYCDSAWYGASCWPRTPANTTVHIPCPAYLIGINASNNASKFCTSNGSWADKADYSKCVETDHTETPKPTDNVPTRVIYNVGFTVSTLALVIALFIFLYFRSLRCVRNSIHSHLIVSFIIKYVLWMIMNHTYIDLHHEDYSWICKTLTTIFNFSNATNFFWMFVEGLYLHIIIVWTYSADKIKLRYLIFIGWVLPALNVAPWIVVRQELENTVCWLPRTDKISMNDIILYGPIFFVLLFNIVFLSTIVWVLITKLRASHTLEIRQYRKAVKATVILFPLLGITYVLFIIPPSNHHQVQTVFEYINAVLQSFQGLLVAVFYCFLNGEVKSVIKKKLSRYNDARALSTKFTRASYGGWTRSSDFGHSVSHGNGTTCVLYVNNNLNSSDNGHAEDIPMQQYTTNNND